MKNYRLCQCPVCTFLSACALDLLALGDEDAAVNVASMVTRFEVSEDDSEGYTDRWERDNVSPDLPSENLN